MTDKAPKSAPQPPKPEQDLNKLSEQQIIDNILQNMPSTDEIVVEVPSRNKFYKLTDPGKPITLRPMTFEDERAMMSNKRGGADVLNMLLTRCVSNIAVGALLQMDKLFLIMKLREISYGNEYSASITCNACSKDNSIKFKLDELPVRYLEEDATDPITLHLPVLDKEVKVRLPRVQDEDYFSNSEQAIGNLWRFVDSIAGCEAKTVISKIIPQLPLKDAHVLLEAMGTSDYGTDTKVRFACSYCSHSEVMELPVTADFVTGK